MNRSCHIPALLTLGVASLMIQNSHGVIAYTGNEVSQTFDNLASTSDWTTGSISGNQDSFLPTLGPVLDTALDSISTSDVSTSLMADGGTTKTQNAIYNDSDDGLQMFPSGNGASALMVTILNGYTGGSVPSLSISYDFTSNLAGGTSPSTEDFANWHGFYSTTGNAGDWTRITDFDGSTGTKSTSINFTSGWNNGDNLYLLWLDDNSRSNSNAGAGGTAQGSNEDRNVLDNFTIGAIPEPSSALLALLGSMSLMTRRRRA